MKERFSLETVYQIWDDDSGERTEIGQDADSLGFIEIRQRDENGKILARLTFPKEMAQLISDSIIKVANDLE